MADDSGLDALLASMVPITLGSESGGRDFGPDGRPLTSYKGAMYGMQVMPSTIADPGFGVRPANPNDPADVNRAGRDYLGAMIQRYHDPAKAWAAYNGGPGRLDKALASGGNWLSHMPGETRSYVANNMARLGSGAPTPPAMENTVASAPLPSALASIGPDPADTKPDQPSGLDMLRQIAGKLDGLDQERAALRQQQLEHATAELQAQRRGLSATDLFQLSAALAAPQRYPGFGGMMNNVTPVLAGISGAHDQANQARRLALASLQDKYLSGGIDDQAGSLDKRVDLAKAMMSGDKPDRQTWSEAMGRFISPDQRQAVGRVVNNGMVGVKYSDGTTEFAAPDGTIGVYDAAGRKVGTRQAAAPVAPPVTAPVVPATPLATASGSGVPPIMGGF